MWPWIAAEAVAAAAVWWDAHRGITYGGPSGRDGSLGAPGWAIMTLLFAPVAVPVYLVRRRRWPSRPVASSEITSDAAAGER